MKILALKAFRGRVLLDRKEPTPFPLRMFALEAKHAEEHMGPLVEHMTHFKVASHSYAYDYLNNVRIRACAKDISFTTVSF